MPESLASTTNISGAASMANPREASPDDTLDRVPYGGNSNYAPSNRKHKRDGQQADGLGFGRACALEHPIEPTHGGDRKRGLLWSLHGRPGYTMRNRNQHISGERPYTSSPVTLNSGGKNRDRDAPNSFTGFTGTENLTLMVRFGGDANYNPANASTSVRAWPTSRL